MSVLLKDKKIPTDQIDSAVNDIKKLYLVHNITRSIVDMVRTDDILGEFYAHNQGIFNLMQISDKNMEPELFILKETLIDISNHIRLTNNLITEMNKVDMRKGSNTRPTKITEE